MKNFSNKYIFIFSSVMVIIRLQLCSRWLPPFFSRAGKNLEIEKKKSMLESINVPAEWGKAEELYDKYIKESFVINPAVVKG